MSATDEPSYGVDPTDPLKVQRRSELDGGWAEARLKRHLGRGVYVQSVSELPNGDWEIVLGNSTPRDLSDSRDRENFLKFVSIRDVATIRAESTGSGYYLVSIPSRETIVEKIEEREQELVDLLDYSMAKTIYRHVYDLPAVKNQLSPILQLLRWARTRDTFTVQEAIDNQRTGQTRNYITFLDSFGYLDVEDGTVKRGEKLVSADLNELGREEFGRRVLGEVVTEGYHTIKDQFGFTMLNHYQKYSGSYYFDALQKDDPDLSLSIDRIGENLEEFYDEERGNLFLDDKLEELANVNVLEKDGEYISSNDAVFQNVTGDIPAV